MRFPPEVLQAVREVWPSHKPIFDDIDSKVLAARAAGQPVISVDTKKKERVGNDKGGGSSN
jgi:hypothetical protein